ncbi:MAG: type II toxin-antitoxin system Phd/YefM family antitoxin [Deltaproteobacteria bacterium]|nr:type II toxin-antitoxin system Phd/YefM family antitoxin [Deltaproteobacteria bacterium]
MKTIALSEAKARLSEVMDEVEDFEIYQLTRNGKSAGILVNPEEWDALRETLAVLADDDLMRQIRASRRSKKTYPMKDVFRGLLK